MFSDVPHDFVEPPFEGGEDPELKVVDSHLAVGEIDDFYGERYGGQFNHKKAQFFVAEYGNHDGDSDYGDKNGVDESGSELGHAADFAYNGPDAFFFLLEVLQFLFEVL